jgi:plasmid stability protein
MPLLQVREFPVDLHEALKQKAKDDNRSVAQETIVLLRDSLGQKEVGRAQLKAAFDDIAAFHRDNPEISQAAQSIDVVKMIREDRDR